MKRGEQAEWCPKCKIMVMPVSSKATVNDASGSWRCGYCATPTLVL